jgi:LacI family transcriptional regulator
MKKTQASLKDIAKALNISISTVSRALRDTGEIHPDTRNKVLALAGKLHYKPNPLAMGLLKNRTHTIGVIIPEIDSSYFSSILRGIDRVAGENGLRLVTCYTGESQLSEVRALDDLMGSRVDGIIACPANDLTDYDHYQGLIENDFPLVHIDRDCKELSVTKIMTNNHTAAFIVTEYLINAGCRHIALITNLEPLSVGRQRYEGYQEALAKYGLRFNRDLIIHSNQGISTSMEGAKNLLELNPLPDAIICNNDTVAMATMKVLKDNGLRIPDDISVVGFSDDPFSAFLEPSLTTVSQPAYLMGMKAMECILDMLNKNEIENRDEKIVMESAFVVRNSVRRKIIP